MDIAKWKRNEANNLHSENALELLRAFGTPEEYEIVKKIHRKHMRIGYIEPEDQRTRDDLVKKYYNNLQTESKSSENSAMSKAIKSIEMTFSPERSKIDDQVVAMVRAVQMLQDERYKNKALNLVSQYGINNEQELKQELNIMIQNEKEANNEYIKLAVDRNIKQMQKALSNLKEDSNGLNTMANSRDRVQSTYAEILKRDAEQTEVGDYISKSMTKAEVLKLIDMLEPQGYDKEFLLKDLAPIMPNESITEEQFDEAAGKKDACYHKVKSRYKVWPSAYASGALVQCRKVGAKNWGNSKKK